MRSAKVRHVDTHPVGELVLGEDGVCVEEEVVVRGRWRVTEHLLRPLPPAEHRGQLRELPLRRLSHRLQLLSAVAEEIAIRLVSRKDQPTNAIRCCSCTGRLDRMSHRKWIETMQ